MAPALGHTAVWPRSSSTQQAQQVHGRGGAQWWSQPTLAQQAGSALGIRALWDWEGCAFDRSLLWSEAMIPLLYFVLPTLGSYIMLSIFFLRRPHLLHTPCAPVFPIRLAAHRGGELSQGVRRDGIHLGWREPNKTGAIVGSPSSRCGALVNVEERGKESHGFWRVCDREGETSSTDWKSKWETIKKKGR